MLRDSSGDEIARTHSTARSADLAFASADDWAARGRLRERNGLDVYVEHEIEYLIEAA